MRFHFAAELEKHLEEANILITTPFHPAYMSKERLQKAKNLKLVMTAGVGSDHIDLQTAADQGMTVVEVTGAGCCLLACKMMSYISPCAISTSATVS